MLDLLPNRAYSHRRVRCIAQNLLAQNVRFGHKSIDSEPHKRFEADVLLSNLTRLFGVADE
jgi:hypothetical protein